VQMICSCETVPPKSKVQSLRQTGNKLQVAKCYLATPGVNPCNNNYTVTIVVLHYNRHPFVLLLFFTCPAPLLPNTFAPPGCP
jgi:hypothetical protein